jgi:hypothetical protein
MAQAHTVPGAQVASTHDIERLANSVRTHQPEVLRLRNTVSLAAAGRRALLVAQLTDNCVGRT